MTAKGPTDNPHKCSLARTGSRKMPRVSVNARALRAWGREWGWAGQHDRKQRARKPY